MMKKLMSVLLLGSLLILFAGCGGGGGDSSSSKSSSSSSTKGITQFALSGVEGTIDETTKEITIDLPAGTPLVNLMATFTVPEGSVLYVNEVPQTSGGNINDFTHPVTYTLEEDGTTQDYTVIARVDGSSEEPSAAKVITAFALNGFNGMINEAAKTITVVMPPGTSLTSLVATFTTTGASVKVGAVVQASGQTPNDFTGPVVYTVTAADASTQDYIVTVTIETERQKATAITVRMLANNPSYVDGGDPRVFCTRTTSIEGTQTVTPNDGRTLIYWEFLKDGQTVISGRGTLAELQKKPPELLPPWRTGMEITYRATADGVVSHSEKVKVA